MLFDLRGQGRRRTIKVIYASLALLMGGGLVLLGVGSDQGGGGLLDAFKDDTQSDSDISKETRQNIERLETRVLAQPKNEAAWAQLTEERIDYASQEGFDEEASAAAGGVAVYTAKGRRILRTADQSWLRYLALEPETPNADVAQLMAQAYDLGGLANFERAVTAQEIVIDANAEAANSKRSGQFRQLAVFAYFAKQDTKGDLAAKRAVALADKDDREELEKELMEAKTAIKAQLAQQQGQQQAQPAQPQQSTTPSE